MNLKNISRDFTRIRNGQLHISDVPGYIEHTAPILRQITEIWDGRDLSLVLAKSIYPKAEIERVSQHCKESHLALIATIKTRFPSIAVPSGELVLGTKTASGHAVKRGDKVVFWLALESHYSKRQIEVFLPHEAAHAIHYSVNPAFYPDTKENYYRTGRALWAEGLATFFSKKILGISAADALWADFHSETWKREWMAYCRVHEGEWFETATRQFDSVVDNGQWFLTDETREFELNRIGYYLGCRLVEKAATHHSMEELFHLSLDNIHKLCKVKGDAQWNSKIRSF